MIVTTTENVPGRTTTGIVGIGLVQAARTAMNADHALGNALAAIIKLAEGADALVCYRATITPVPGFGWAATATATAVNLASGGLSM